MRRRDTWGASEPRIQQLDLRRVRGRGLVEELFANGHPPFDEPAAPD